MRCDYLIQLKQYEQAQNLAQKYISVKENDIFDITFRLIVANVMKII